MPEPKDLAAVERTLMLERLSENIRLTKELDVKIDRLLIEKLPAIEIELAQLKTKASIWGGVAGTIGGMILSAAISLLMRGLH